MWVGKRIHEMVTSPASLKTESRGRGFHQVSEYDIRRIVVLSVLLLEFVP